MKEIFITILLVSAASFSPAISTTVPYDFCSDEYRDSQLGCDVFG